MFQRAFSVSTREPAAPVFWAGGRLPHRGFVVCCNGGMFVRLTACVSCAIRRARSFVCTIACVHDRGRAVPVAVVHGRRTCGRGVVAVITAVPCPPWPSVMSWLWCRDHGRPGRPSCMAVVPWFLCRRRVVATRRWMLVFATVYVVSALSRFAICLDSVYSGSHQANDNERNRDEREATTTETTTARTVTRSPP